MWIHTGTMTQAAWIVVKSFAGDVRPHVYSKLRESEAGYAHALPALLHKAHRSVLNHTAEALLISECKIDMHVILL